MKLILSSLLVLTSMLTFTACRGNQVNPTENSTKNQAVADKMSSQIPDEEQGAVVITPDIQQDIKKEAYDYSGMLEDVTGGESTGVALATYQDGIYKLQVNFENLPKLAENFFYEGWLVRKAPFHFISTGELVQENGQWANYYASETDLTDHTIYVLTVEPSNDGLQGGADPTPAEHLLEGTISKL